MLKGLWLTRCATKQADSPALHTWSLLPNSSGNQVCSQLSTLHVPGAPAAHLCGASWALAKRSSRCNNAPVKHLGRALQGQHRNKVSLPLRCGGMRQAVVLFACSSSMQSQTCCQWLSWPLLWTRAAIL